MTFQLRRDVSTNWAAVNPTLLPGEPAYETDTQILRIGDGANEYVKLPQFGNADNGVAGGRLSITQFVPVIDDWATGTTTVSTLFYVPYRSDKIALWSGTAWRQYKFDTTTRISLAGLNANRNYDIFAYQNNGTVTLNAVEWANNVTRSANLVLLNGVFVRSGMANMRYIGTIRTTETAGVTADSITRRFVFNYYNQIQRVLFLNLAAVHTYSVPTWRIWNNNTGIAPYLQYVQGVRQPIATTWQFQARYGYIQVRAMAGVPYNTTLAAPAAIGATTLTLALADSNLLPNYTTLSASGLPASPLVGVSAVNGNVVTIRQPVVAAMPTGTVVTVGPERTITLDAAYNAISPTQLSNVAYATVTGAGQFPSFVDGGYGSLVACEAGISADSSFLGGTMSAQILM